LAAIKKYQQEMFQVVAQKRFWLTNLGYSDVHPIWLLRTRLNRSHDDPKILVVSGFHGEEPAGPYAVLKWLQNCDPKALKDYDISFIPIVNPGAFAKGTRYSAPDEISNCGFCHPEVDGDEKSVEGVVLANSIDLLKPIAKDGYLSLHEDKDERKFYLYSFEEGTKEPGHVPMEIKKTLGQHFKAFVDGDEVEVDCRRHKKVKVVNGMVHNFCDGSFDDWMFHLGVPYVIVTETPGRYKLSRRVDAGVAVIDRFITLILEDQGDE